jgi:predicted metal-dependent hydrolase
MMEALPDVVSRHVDPPQRAIDGCADVPNEAALLGIEAFNRGEYFDQHEYFEEAWLAEERPVREMYQGILQVGVAYLQIERDNWAGALKTFRRGLPRLRTLPPTCQGIDIDSFRRVAEAIHLEITQLGPDRLDEFDRGRFPKIKKRN